MRSNMLRSPSLHRRLQHAAPHRPASRSFCCLVTCSSGSKHTTPTRHTVNYINRRALALALGSLPLAIGHARHASAVVVDEDVSTKVFETAVQSVVSIRRRTSPNSEQQVLGTGVLWDSYGHILTNYHVISKITSDKSSPQLVEVSALDTSTGELWVSEAVILATDSYRDLAVLEVPDLQAAPLSPVKAGPSSDLKVGQYVYCLGAPAGDNPTMTVGVLSGTNRSFPSASANRIYGALQVEASVNQDNSGGPLLDSFGRMVGLCTATYSTSKTLARGSGINFALPMDTVREAVPQLILYGSASGRR